MITMASMRNVLVRVSAHSKLTTKGFMHEKIEA